MLPDGYQLEEQISSTPSSQVWIARNERGRSVALKLASDDDRIRRRFQREIIALEDAHGTHVMPVLDYDDSRSWYAMPLARGALHNQGAPIPIPDAVLVLEAIAEALRPTHARGQVHRDLKPQNVLWLEDVDGARWVVADFGIVRNAPGETTSQLTRIGGLLGTPGWAAPELHEDAHGVTPLADVFGAGAILSWMLTGTTPSLTSVALPTDPAVRAVVRRATAPNPSRRHASLDDLLEDLVEATGERGDELDHLIQIHNFSGIASYILSRPAQLEDAVKLLPGLDRAAVRRWYASEPDGLYATIEFVLGELGDGVQGIRFQAIDQFLTWCLYALEAAFRARRWDDAESLAIELFSSIAEIHQFAPARNVLDWLDRLGDREQSAMETALRSSTGLGFFKSQASGRWRTQRTGRLVRWLMTE